MSNVNLVDSLLSKVQDANFTEEELLAMGAKNLKLIAGYNGRATPLPDHIRKDIETRGWREANATLALKLLTSSAAKSKLHIRPDDHLRTNGGSIYYTPKEVKYQALNGDVQIRANSAIPANFGQAEARSNVQAVAAAIGQIVKNNQGEWQSAVSPIVWSKVFNEQALSVGGMAMVAKIGCTILAADTVWKLMSQIDKNAVTGNEMLAFVRSALDRCDPVAYDLINTALVVDGLGAFAKRGSDWVRVEVGGKPKIPETCYERKRASFESKKALQDKYPGVFWYLGGYAPKVSLPPYDGELKSVILAGQRLREVQGPDDCVTSILTNMRDYSGLTDEYGKRIQFILAATIFAWSKRRQVDIQLYSIGDHMKLVSSLNFWRRMIIDSAVAGGKKFPYGFYNSKGEAVPSEKDFCNVQFLLPRQLDLPNVHSSLLSTVTDSPRSGSVVIFYNNATLPTSGTQGTAVDYDASSVKLVPSIFLGNDYICYSPIYGCAPWMHNDAKVARARAHSTVTLASWPIDPFVYQFGNSSQFRGIMTTLKDFYLMGWGFRSLGGGKWDMIGDPTLVPVYLTLIPTQEKWYHQVYRDVVLQVVGWLRPVSRYSPISNLPYMSKVGVVLMLSKVEGDDGVLIGNVTRVESREATGVRIRVWDDEENIPDNSAGVAPLINTTDQFIPGVNTQGEVIAGFDEEDDLSGDDQDDGAQVDPEVDQVIDPNTI